ncbi:uncharacterized protein BXZ73DRAFT_107525 [Epithele typhae]|uniref:uncharacterized protein n=1 Tax=Epithele typhae TaxID=378194 RepID=UPI002008AB72|nr:uncharacterized protein BXZ73DRAFT_107525 [Epithele typhae]KAH9912240.1 hypothetical protein BXZ73DRAFT_107525 [Epithele typhae]
MDELIRHCLRELSFDGDLGCDASRLHDFILDFYTHQAHEQEQEHAAQGPASGLPAQTIDDAFCAFVWAVIVLQPGVRVGTVPVGGSTEVYIAPQASAVRKAKAKGGEDAPAPAPAAGLDIIEDATVRPFEELWEAYEDKLRIAVDPETTFFALTGSHVRPSKLTPMIYTGLQMITRGRDQGISVVELGRKSGYDQKTCFYIIKQLVELDLVVKLRQPGVSGNICVHKYFYERSPVWQQVVAEEKEAVSKAQVDGGDSEEEDEADETKPLTNVHFDPIDSRHLSSLPVLKARLMKLLKNCPHQMHTSTNLMIKIGFVNPVKADRRFFRTRLRELEDQGFIERVRVAHINRKRFPDKKIICIRLISSDGEEPEGALAADEDVEMIEPVDDTTAPKTNVSIHRQIIDIIASAGTKGVTLNDISVALGDFDKRTIDLLLNRLAKDLAETHGRERRYKYYTAAHYRALAEEEQFDDNDGAVDAFYEDAEALDAYLQRMTAERMKGPGKKEHINPILPDGSVKKGRPRKSDVASEKKGKKRKRDEEEGEGVEPPPKKKRGRPPKVRPPEGEAEAGPSTATPSAPRKRGRPRKHPLPEETNAEARPSTAVQESISQAPAPKRRGRPPKKRLAEVPSAEDAPAEDAPAAAVSNEPGVIVAPENQEPTDADATPVPPIEPAVVPLDTADSASVGVRRSARTLKVRKRGESQSPVRKTPRRASRPTAVTTAEADVSSNIDVDRPAERDPRPAKDEAFAASDANKVQEVRAVVSVVQTAEVAAPQADLPDVPIDPALLELQSISQALISMTPEAEIPVDAQDVSKKRDEPETPSSQPASKRIKTEGSSKFKARQNLSQSRRENEIMRMLNESDGIMNTSCKEFFEAHAALVDTITASGQEASTRPGAKIDKRTLDATLKELETKGKIRLITTSVSTLTGGTRLARIMYHPDTTQDALNVFLVTLSQDLQVHQPISNAPKKTVAFPVQYGGASRQRPSKTPSNIVQDVAEDQQEVEEVKVGIANLPQLFEKDDQTIRDALLMDKNTVAQLYGYIAGRAARARLLHSLTVELFEKDSQSSQIVSHEHKIVHLSYYFTDIPIATYCALIAVVSPMEELEQLLQTPQGCETPMHSVSDSIRKLLAPSQARSRTRIVSLMDILRTLGIVTPLVPSESPNPSFTCPNEAQHPTTFEYADAAQYTPTGAPLFWKFNDAVPLHLWAVGEGAPSTWKTVSVATTEQVDAYWRDLERVSADPAYALELLGAAPASEGQATEEVKVLATTLRRAASWSPTYNLSFYQTEFLRRFIEPTTGNTPLEILDEAARGVELGRLAWVISSSPDTVACWFEKARKRHARDLKKLKTKSRGKRKARAPDANQDQGARDAELAAELARRAAEERARREADWAEMVARVHPGELRASAVHRVHRVRGRFLAGAGKPGEKWEGRIREAIREADVVAEALLSQGRAGLFAQAAIAVPSAAGPPVAVAAAVQEKDVDELIAAQGPRVAKNATTGQKTKKGKGKGKDTEKAPKDHTPRRHRFLWNRDYDEMVRDGSVIIKARCRHGTRLDWGAMEQVFPAVPRNSVRQRLVHLKEVPGTETYLTRLEDKWYEVWVQNRGTDELPDPDPESATNFDLAAHIKFLRKHVDKNAIRVGFVEIDANQKVDLPATLEDIDEHYDVVEKHPSAPPWDFMWTVVAEEAREKLFAHHAFTADIEDMPPASSHKSDLQYVADAAVKIALGNPNETYDMDLASDLLKAVGEDRVKSSTTDLLNRGVLAKMVRDPAKLKPGRTLKISESNSNALGGQLPRELFQDAVALEETIVQQQQLRESESTEDWQEWPLLATDGDTAFLLELASDGKARFDVDTSQPRSMRAAIDWNSKKADDDDIETAVRVHYADIDAPPSDTPAGPDEGREPQTATLTTIPLDPALVSEEAAFAGPHGVLLDGAPAFCRQTSDGLVDCPACIEAARTSLLAQLEQNETWVACRMVAALRSAGVMGLTKRQLLTDINIVEDGEEAPAGITESTVFAVARRLTDGEVPLAHWTGYITPVLVSAMHLREWTVVVTGRNAAADDADGSHTHVEGTDDDAGTAARANARKSMLFPRRWLDIRGWKLTEVWDAALRAVLALVLLRPGISQAEIRWRLRSVYDRQEVGEVLQALLEEGQIAARVAEGTRTPFEGGIPADEQEEKFICWFLADGERRWYQL